MRFSSMAILALLTSAPAFAQGINCDIGEASSGSIPTSAFGAGSGQVGVWNLIPGSPTTTSALKDLAGNTTAVSVTAVSSGATAAPFSFNNPATNGDDQALMDDGTDPGTSPETWTINGLAAGSYIVYSYAWAPDDPTFISKVAVAGSPDAQQSVGGTWPSGYVLGITHALHHVTIGAGGSIAITLTVGSNYATLNGFQIVPDAPGFESFCTPGTSGVMLCPCTNGPTGTNRGCNNSAATGGASIAASGSASLAADTLVFASSNQTANGTTILLQGDAALAAGTAFGQGVRCVNGNLKRLYVKVPAGTGGITAPVGGDLSVSAQSAALGDVIPAAAHRYYMTYYRDPVVLGGCPAASTFNGTNAVNVTWLP